MASSQKHAGKILVPWFNTNEWKHVYDSIFSESTTHASKLRALELLLMWKTRTPRLPSGVEGTLIILDAILQDEEHISEETLRNLYGTAIMRFLNLCGASGDKQGTFYRTAKQNNLPDWLIDLRHDIAHDQIVPSRDMLERGLEVCLDWLKREYWKKQEASITDYVISFNPDRKIEVAMKLYCQINLIQYLNNSKSLIQLDDQTLMEKFEIIKDIVLIDLNMHIKDVAALLLEALNSYITSVNTNGELISEAVLESGSLFSMEIFKDFSETIPNDFVNIWEPLLNLLYRKNMLIAFIKKLISIINSGTLESSTKVVASLWLTEILRGLVLTKNIYDAYYKSPNHHELNKNLEKVTLKNTIQNENLELRQVLDFNIDYYEDICQDLDAVTLNVIENASSFSSQLMQYILRLRGLSECSADNVKEIIAKYVCPGNVNETRLEDHPNLTESSLQASPNNAEMLNVVLDEDGTQLSTDTIECSDTNNSKEIYRRVEDTSIFEGCPLGVFKDQFRDNNPLLHFQ
ncbi:hypothetical protein ILUMI_07243 [Ignelater luminosus]|uniref:LAS1-like protein n=1 Tax=Ignelater luminosus TaxID=2038154 RepID=A0A8K0D490_IGNLU|nr:hypothetical protein ILUMI_07243 [Ignelater luminosus]